MLGYSQLPRAVAMQRSRGVGVSARCPKYRLFTNDIAGIIFRLTHRREPSHLFNFVKKMSMVPGTRDGAGGSPFVQHLFHKRWALPQWTYPPKIFDGPLVLTKGTI